MLTLNLNILWTFINIPVIYIIVKKFLLKPVNAIIEKRQQLIRDALDNAKNTEAEAIRLKEGYRERISKADTEAGDIIKAAIDRGNAEYNSILESAKQEAASKITAAEKTIYSEKEKAERELHTQIADIAILAAEKLTAETIDKNRSDEIIDRLLTEAGVDK